MRRHMIQTLQQITLYCPMKALVSQPAMAVLIPNGISQNWYAEQWTPVNAMTWVYIAECWNQYCSFWFNSSYSIVSYVAARLIVAADSMVAYSMLILCIGTKISPNLISPTARVAHQEVVGGALEWTRHAWARISNVLVLYSHTCTVRTIDLSLLSFLGLSLLHAVHSSVGLCDGGRL